MGLISNLTRLVLNHPENKKFLDQCFVNIDDSCKPMSVFSKKSTKDQDNVEADSKSELHQKMHH